MSNLSSVLRRGEMRSPTERAVLVLQVGAALCYIGHGAFGIITRPAWIRYFAVAGIGEAMAYRLMPLIGVVDVAFGLLILLLPRRALLAWMILWALWTAVLRPLAGEPAWEALERAGNYGVPAALLVLSMSSWRGRDVVRSARGLLVITVALLLVGHGALSIGEKPLILSNFASVTGASAASAVAVVAGVLEIAAAAAVLVRPSPTLLAGVAAWKLLTELLFITAGAPVWELVERSGSFAAPIALALLLADRSRQPVTSPEVLA